MAIWDTLLKAAPPVNRAVTGLLSSSGGQRLMSGSFAVITYTGRRSGRSFSTPVNYRRRGDEVVIGVMGPEHKKWWRNFTGEGGPISITLDGGERSGHAVAAQDDKGRVSVTVALDPA